MRIELSLWEASRPDCSTGRRGKATGTPTRKKGKIRKAAGAGRVFDLRRVCPPASTAEWEDFRKTPRTYLVFFVPRKLANPNVSNDEKLHSWVLVGGFAGIDPPCERRGRMRCANHSGSSEAANGGRMGEEASSEAPRSVAVSPAFIGQGRSPVVGAGLAASATESEWSRAIGAMEGVLIFGTVN